MKKIILLFVVSLSVVHLYSQSETELKDPENKFLYVVHKSSKCEIYYGNGHGEQVDANPLKLAKITGVDAEEQNIAVVVNKIISNGWKLYSIESAGDQGKPSYYFFTRQ